MNILKSLGTPLLLFPHYPHQQALHHRNRRGFDKRRKYEGYIYQILLVLLTSGKLLRNLTKKNHIKLSVSMIKINSIMIEIISV